MATWKRGNEITRGCSYDSIYIGGLAVHYTTCSKSFRFSELCTKSLYLLISVCISVFSVSLW